MSMSFRDLPGCITHMYLLDRESAQEAVTLVRSCKVIADVLSQLFWQAAWPHEPWSVEGSKEPEHRDRFAKSATNVYQAMVILPESRMDLRHAVQPVADEMNQRGIRFSIEHVKPDDFLLEGDKLGLIQARLWKTIGHLLLHDVELSEPLFTKLLEHARVMSRGLLLNRIGFFRKEYHVGLLHQGDRDNLLDKARKGQPRYSSVADILAAMQVATDKKIVSYL